MGSKGQRETYGLPQMQVTILGQAKTVIQKTRLETKKENEIMIKKEFPCDNGICNHIITATSPDDSYTQFFSERCCEKSKEKKYECESCDFINTRFWCIHHLVIASTNYDTEEAQSGLDSIYST